MDQTMEIIVVWGIREASLDSHASISRPDNSQKDGKRSKQQ